VLFFGIGTVTLNLNTADGTASDSGNVPALLLDMTGNANLVGRGADQSLGSVPVRVRSNSGVITLLVNTTGNLANGSGASADTIPWSEILSSTGSSTGGGVPVPDVSTGTSVNITPATGKVTDATAVWTFKFDNAATYAPGIYGGTGPSDASQPGTNNGRVTYTATVL